MNTSGDWDLPPLPVKERREVQRFDLRLPARIEKASGLPESVPMVLNLTTSDISACGAFFPSACSFEEGTRVKMDLVLTPENPQSPQVNRALIKVDGTVLRMGPEGMAVGFDKHYNLAPLK